jgi:hypothetical protein
MARLTRALVLGSMLLAIGAGLWPLQSQPGLVGALGSTVAAVAILARMLPSMATALVLAFAYVSYGLVRLVAGPEVAAMPFFLAAFSGLALGTGSWTTWTARPPWRLPLAWWGTTVALTWPYVAARELHFSLTPSLAAGPIMAAALLQMALALWMDRLLREADGTTLFQDDDLPLRGWHRPLMLSGLATAGAALYQRWGDLAFLSGEPWIRLGRATGLMGDANPLGVATALWAPITVAAFATSAASTVLGAALSVPLWLAAWASGARTTLILFGAGTAALLLLITNTWGWSRRSVIVAGAVAGVVVLAVALALAPRVEPSTPIGRLLAAIPKSSLGDAAYELLWNRDGYGAAAAAAINDHPLAGVGIGRFTGLSTTYSQRATGRAVPADNAQNLWRHTLAEQGVIGLVPVLWLSALTVLAVFSGPAKGIELVLRIMLTGLGVSLLVGYPVQDPAIAVTLATLVAAVARQQRRR